MTRRPVVVVGSGAAGLSAALGAAAGGARVVVLEADETVGGTTALSGGVVWIPASEAMKEAGIEDSPSEARRYLAGLATGDVDDLLIDAFTSDAGRVAAEIEKQTPLRWEVLTGWPDYREEIPGALAGGRSLWPRSFSLGAEVETRIHPAPDQPGPPRTGDDPDTGPSCDGVVFRGPVRGRALVAGLLAGANDAGVEVRTGARVTGLVDQGGGVVGVQVGDDEFEGRVVLATGGFQHHRGLVTTYLKGAPVAPMGTPGCAGDGLQMALSVDAAVGNMGEGWWMPAIQIPGEDFDGVLYYRPLHSERAYPGAVMVDATGRRFANEAQNYGDVGRAMMGSGGRHWLIFDARCRRHYPVGPVGPGDPDPPWFRRADGLGPLAGLIDVDSDILGATVATFNDGARQGRDGAFGRGSLPYDLWIGDPSAPHPTLAPLEEPPYYALEVRLGCMGTKGGPRTDVRGRVLTASGSVVPGLYAAGNVAANPFGTATPAGGGTLGPALVFGYRAGEAAAGDQ